MDELADLAGTAMQGAQTLGGAAAGAINHEAGDIAGAVTHGGAALGDVLTGDLGGAADEALSAGQNALGAATFGLSDTIGEMLGGGDHDLDPASLPTGELTDLGDGGGASLSDGGDYFPGDIPGDGDPGMDPSSDPTGGDGYGGGDDSSYDPLPDPSGMDGMDM